ncbi:MAG: lamin tail domain-containing protein [Bacteroidales bacterium]|nr:lamin tail domain-containing protein [Bacteroidales bacterium]
MKKLLLSVFTIFIAFSMTAQNCTELFISEYVEGSGNNKAIELYNPTNAVVDLTPYQLVRYSNGETTPNAVQLAGGFIQPKSTYVIVLDKRDPGGTGYEQPVDSALLLLADTFLCPVYEVNKMMYFNGNDAVTLEKDGGSTIVDIFAIVGPPDTDNGWTDITDTTITWNNQGTPEDYTIVDYGVGPLFWLSWTKDHTLIRKPEVSYGITENPDVFIVTMQWDSLPQNTFDSLGSHFCDCNTFGISDIENDIDVVFYPNPVTDGKLTIDADYKIIKIEIFNILGKAILNKNYQSGLKNTVVDINKLESSIYFVNVTFENNQTVMKKIIIR